MRTTLSIAFGICIWLLMKFGGRMQPENVVFATEFWINFSRLVGSQLINFSLHIVPWLLVGITAPHRQVMCGGISATIASLIYTLVLTPPMPSTFLPTGVAIAIVVAAVQFFYGATGAALGLLLGGGANNSFKPTPLRGAA